MQAVTHTSTKDMPREDWLAERRKGLGGSDAAAILGVNPYRSALAVYMDKLGLAPEREDSEAMRQGRDLEQYVAERFVDATGKKVRRCNQILQHKEHDWMLANVDRLVVGEDAGLECKTTSVYNKTDFDRGDVPPTYYWQCQWYMAVTGHPKWYLAVLILNRSFHVFEIERNDEHIEVMTARASDFWHNNVLAGVPPLPSGTDGDDELIAIMPHGNDADDVIDIQDFETEITLMQMLKKEKDEREQRINTIKQHIAMRLDGAEAGRSNHWQITYKQQTINRLDGDRLKAELPEIAAKYTKQTTSRVLRVKEIKE